MGQNEVACDDTYASTSAKPNIPPYMDSFLAPIIFQAIFKI